jgi:hypothetical protein
MVEWHDQCVHLSDLHASWLTYIVMIIGELCNFTAYAFVEALVVVRHPLFITFVCLSSSDRHLSEPSRL